MDRGEEGKAGGRASDSAALGLALDAARADPAMADEARAYLRAHTRFLHLQAEQLRAEGRLEHWSLQLRHASAVFKVAFELSVALVLAGIVTALAAACWSAAHDNGLVIESFSVPPDFAERGLTGQAVASQFLDKLTRMQDETNSVRAAGTYRSNWGDDIKVAIPDTGISIGELNRYVRQWLGHETHITGELWRTPAGIALTARAAGAGTTFAGKNGDLDRLLEKAAESIYGQTQPYRYAAFLVDQSRIGEALMVLQAYAPGASPAERAWAYSFLGNLYQAQGRTADALRACREAVAADPLNAHAWDNLANREQELIHNEAAYQDTLKALPLYDNGAASFNPDKLAIVKLTDRSSLASTLGDYQTAADIDEEIRRAPDRGGSQLAALDDEITQTALDHDTARATLLSSLAHPGNDSERLNYWFANIGALFAEEKWNAVIRQIDQDRFLAMGGASLRPALAVIYPRIPLALLAWAKAKTGDIVGARRLIEAAPLDCYDCVIARASIEAEAKNWDGADKWFAMAVHDGPSLPDAWSYWGAMLLAKGDAAVATAKFAVAHAKGPRYADPLEMWGEALMRENRSDLALAKFEEANKYAPNWGRLHLKWGEALWYTGQRDEARGEFKLAGRLALTSEERAEVKKFSNAS